MHVTHDSAAGAAPEIGFDQFLAVDIRVGTIVEALPFPEARKPAYRLLIDFGPAIGRKRSSVQITEHYTLDELPGMQIAAVVNFPPRQIGPVRSEVLTLGTYSDPGVLLVSPDTGAQPGDRLG